MSDKPSSKALEAELDALINAGIEDGKIPPAQRKKWGLEIRARGKGKLTAEGLAWGWDQLRRTAPLVTTPKTAHRPPAPGDEDLNQGFAGTGVHIHDPHRPEKPDWTIWGLVPDAPIYETAVLSCNVAPEWFERGMGPSPILDEIVRRETAIETLLRRGAVFPGIIYRTDPDTLVQTTALNFRSFRPWAETALKWTFPEEFPKPIPEPPAAPAPLAVGRGRWPWGTFETPLLRHLADAAAYFWAAGYSVDSAPTNETVEKWLMAKGVPGRVAEIMAQILRPPDIPAGPRRKPFKKK